MFIKDSPKNFNAYGKRSMGLYFFFFNKSSFLHKGITSDCFSSPEKEFSWKEWSIKLVKGGTYICADCFKIVVDTDLIEGDFLTTKA